MDSRSITIAAIFEATIISPRSVPSVAHRSFWTILVSSNSSRFCKKDRKLASFPSPITQPRLSQLTATFIDQCILMTSLEMNGSRGSDQNEGKHQSGGKRQSQGKRQGKGQHQGKGKRQNEGDNYWADGVRCDW